MSIVLKSQKEIDAIHEACQLAAETLLVVGDQLRVGMTTEDINTIVHEDTLRRGAYPSPLNYKGFPKSVCTSVNDVVCHGIPDGRVLKNGDIVNVDVTSFYKGYHGDTSATFYIGQPSPAARHVTEVARKALELGIAEVHEGARLGDIGAAIQEYVEANGCGVVRDYVGHGIGKKFHEDPQVKHYGKRNTGERIRVGMVFTIEPMVNEGGFEVKPPKDKWTVTTADGSLSAQFEHTIAVAKDGVHVLTTRSRTLKFSENIASVFAL